MVYERNMNPHLSFANFDVLLFIVQGPTFL